MKSNTDSLYMKTFLVTTIAFSLLVILIGASLTAHASLNRHSRTVTSSVTVEVVPLGQCGDQNDDGAVDIWDVVFDLQVSEDLILANSIQNILSDLDRDGEITHLDAELSIEHIVAPDAPLTECGSAPPPSTTPGTLDSQIANFTLEDLSISVGTTVVWENQDAAPHTVTSGVSPDKDGNWDSEVLNPVQTFTFTFQETGQFPYFCAVHPFMTAMVTVN